MSSKKELIDQLLKDEYCLIHINPSYPGTALPDHVKNEITLTLKLSHYFAGFIDVKDLAIDAELRFGSTPYPCHIPMDAVWAVSSVKGEHTTWSDLAPHETLIHLLTQTGQKKESKATPTLAVAKQEMEIGEPKPKEQSSEKKGRPSFLKRVK